MFNEVIVVNIREKREATSEEVKELIEDGQLFVNRYLHNDHVFIDLNRESQSKFTLRDEEL